MDRSLVILSPCLRRNHSLYLHMPSLRSNPLTIAINARLVPEDAGGVAPFVAGLVHGLGQLTDGEERYVIFIHPSRPRWLDGVLGNNQRLIGGRRSASGRLLDVLRPLKPHLRLLMELQLQLRARREHEDAGSTFDVVNPDVIHFPFQHMAHTDVPAIFNPHDLLHLHFPQFLGRGTLAWRQATYPRWCERARFVVAESNFVRNDLIEQYRLPPSKVAVIPRGAPTQLYENPTDADLTRIRGTYNLPGEFIFYPAQTWPHKNHLKLLEGIHVIKRERGRIVHLVCSGTKNYFWKRIKRAIDELRLTEQIHFLDYIPNNDLKGVYALSRAVVFPTLFEGGGFPLLEARQMNKPIACSDIPPLREVAGDAVRYFDPRSAEEIAQAVLDVLESEPLRQQLVTEADLSIPRVTWTDTAASYRALYRLTAGSPLSGDDEAILKKIFLA
jgi:glycosyltransferase involved in cell wall biosynthesis